MCEQQKYLWAGRIYLFQKRWCEAVDRVLILAGYSVELSVELSVRNELNPRNCVCESRWAACLLILPAFLYFTFSSLISSRDSRCWRENAWTYRLIKVYGLQITVPITRLMHDPSLLESSRDDCPHRIVEHCNASSRLSRWFRRVQNLHCRHMYVYLKPHVGTPQCLR